MLKPLFPFLTVVLAGAVLAGASSGEKRTPELVFDVVSDIHVQAYDPATGRKFRKALKDLNKAAPDAEALVVNGDLGGGRPEDFQTLEKLMNTAPHPGQVYYTIGNHEFYKAWLSPKGSWEPEGFPNGETESGSIRRFLDFTGYSRVYRDVWLEGYHFLFLGMEAYRQSDPGGGEEARLSDEQLNWLERTIGVQEEANKPIFVFLHQPLPDTVAGSRTASRDPGVTSSYNRLRAILSAHPQAILFSGHTHWELKSKDTLVCGPFTMIGSSSVWEPYNEEDRPYAEEDRMSEGLVVRVYRDGLRIRGRNFARGKWVKEADFRIPFQKEPPGQRL